LTKGSEGCSTSEVPSGGLPKPTLHPTPQTFIPPVMFISARQLKARIKILQPF